MRIHFAWLVALSMLYCNLTAFGALPVDLDRDLDVDGRDLAMFSQDYPVGSHVGEDLLDFVTFFGRMDPGRTIYVDFDNGRDTADGMTPKTAWRHAPGDPVAEGFPAETDLQPGDTVLFRPDVIYRGQIQIAADGSTGMPITYQGDGWPGMEGMRAVIDGGELMEGWRSCSSAAECAGNPYFEHIFYTDIPQGTSSFTLNLHEADPLTGEDHFLWLAQDPNPSAPYFMDNRFEFISVPQSGLTRTSVTDAAHFNQSDSEYWTGAALMI